MLSFLRESWRCLAAALGTAAAFLLLRRREPEKDESLADLAPYPPIEPQQQQGEAHVRQAARHTALSERYEAQANAREQRALQMTKDQLSEAMAKDMKRFTRGGGALVLLLLLSSPSFAQERMVEVNHPDTGEVGWWLAVPYVQDLFAIKQGDAVRRESLRQCRASVDRFLEAKMSWDGERRGYRSREASLRVRVIGESRDNRELRSQVTRFAKWRGWRIGFGIGAAAAAVGGWALALR